MTYIKDEVVNIYIEGKRYAKCVSRLAYGDVFYDEQGNMWLVCEKPFIEADRWLVRATVIGFRR